MSDYAITMHPYCCYINHSKFAAWYFIIVHMYSSNKECPISFYSGVDKQTSYCNRYTLLLTNTETVFIILGGGAYIRSSRRVAQNSFNPWTKNFSMRTFCQSGPTFILSPESNKSLKKIPGKMDERWRRAVSSRDFMASLKVFSLNEGVCLSASVCVCGGGAGVCVQVCLIMWVYVWVYVQNPSVHARSWSVVLQPCFASYNALQRGWRQN